MLIKAAGGDSARLGLDQRELPSHPKIFPPLLRVSWASFLFGQGHHVIARVRLSVWEGNSVRRSTADSHSAEASITAQLRHVGFTCNHRHLNVASDEPNRSAWKRGHGGGRHGVEYQVSGRGYGIPTKGDPVAHGRGLVAGRERQEARSRGEGQAARAGGLALGSHRRLRPGRYGGGQHPRRREPSALDIFWNNGGLSGRAHAAGDVKLHVHAGGDHEVRREGKGPELSVLSTLLGEPMRERLALQFPGLQHRHTALHGRSGRGGLDHDGRRHRRAQRRRGIRVGHRPPVRPYLLRLHVPKVGTVFVQPKARSPCHRGRLVARRRRTRRLGTRPATTRGARVAPSLGDELVGSRSRARE